MAFTNFRTTDFLSEVRVKLMPRSKKQSYFPKVSFPCFSGLSQRDEQGVLVVDLSRRIQSAILPYEFYVANELPALRTEKTSLDEREIDALLDGFEHVLEQRDAYRSRQSSGDLVESATQLQQAAANLEAAMKAYTEDGTGH